MPCHSETNISVNAYISYIPVTFVKACSKQGSLIHTLVFYSLLTPKDDFKIEPMTNEMNSTFQLKISNFIAKKYPIVCRSHTSN